MSAIETLSPTPDPEPWVPEDTFGSRLALIRNRLGWNVSEAARACSTTDQSWHNWEAGGNPRSYQQVCERIAKASGCNIVWLMLGEQAVPRSRCFSPLAQVSDVPGQMELSFEPVPDLSLV